VLRLGAVQVSKASPVKTAAGAGADGPAWVAGAVRVEPVAAVPVGVAACVVLLPVPVGVGLLLPDGFGDGVAVPPDAAARPAASGVPPLSALRAVRALPLRERPLSEPPETAAWARKPPPATMITPAAAAVWRNHLGLRWRR
jgi:hypothetical protein